MRHENQAGSGRAGFILTLAIVGCVIFALVRIVPVRISAYEFRDTLRQEARMGAVRKSNEEVAQRIMAEAKDLEIPLARKNLKISRTKSKFIVAVQYEQPVDLKVTTYVYKFNAREEAPLF